MSKNQAGSQAPLKAHDAEAQRDPGTDLFLWAVVQSSRELAEIAWEQVPKTLFMWCMWRVNVAPRSFLYLSWFLCVHSVETAHVALWLPARS